MEQNKPLVITISRQLGSGGGYIGQQLAKKLSMYYADHEIITKTAEELSMLEKDLAMQAISYGNVYVARIAFGANPQQTLLAMREAEAYDGPALILAYSHCIAHGYDLKNGLDQQHNAVASGHWPLLRYNPALRNKNQNPFVLDSPRPTMSLKDYAYNELRYKVLTLTNPEAAERLMKHAQELVNLKWKSYEELATKKASDFVPVG